MRIFLMACLTLFCCDFSWAKSSDTPSPDWPYIRKKLKQAKLPESFIQEMQKIYRSDQFVKVLELNILLFLRTTDYHSPQVSGDAVSEVKQFVSKNKKAFDSIEK